MEADTTPRVDAVHVTSSTRDHRCCSKELSDTCGCGACYSAIACLSPLVASMSLGFTSPALDTMSGQVRGAQEPPELIVFPDGSAAGPWFSSLVNIGALLGACLGGWLCTRVGHNNVLRISA